jgi:tetraacyldisaccharide 4'-kinase
VLAVSGVADPVGFSRQLGQLGARVTAATCGNHHRYTNADVVRLSRAAGAADYVVMTHKDAVKLRPLWSRAEPQPLVAHLEPTWELGRDLVASRITDLLTRHYTLGMY